MSFVLLPILLKEMFLDYVSILLDTFGARHGNPCPRTKGLFNRPSKRQFLDVCKIATAATVTSRFPTWVVPSDFCWPPSRLRRDFPFVPEARCSRGSSLIAHSCSLCIKPLRLRREAGVSIEPGVTALTRILRFFRSTVQVRERTYRGLSCAINTEPFYSFGCSSRSS